MVRARSCRSRMVGSDCLALGSSNTFRPSDSVLPSGRDTWDVEKGRRGGEEREEEREEGGGECVKGREGEGKEGGGCVEERGGEGEGGRRVCRRERGRRRGRRVCRRERGRRRGRGEAGRNVECSVGGRGCL